jgi:hypothetical protein
MASHAVRWQAMHATCMLVVCHALNIRDSGCVVHATTWVVVMSCTD